MRRILHVASGREWRGGQRQTWLLARELQKGGVDQLLITRRGSELARRAGQEGVPVREVAWGMGIDPRAWWAVRREARRTPSLLHAHDGHAVTIARWASDGRTPWIATRRNASPLGAPSGWQGAGRVVAISEGVARQLVADGISPDRIAVVPSGIDAAEVRRTPRESLRAWAGIPEGPPVIVTVAAVTKEKGLPTAMDAAAILIREHRDLYWVMVGDGALRGSHLATSAQPRFEGRIKLPGHHPEPTRLMRDATVFVLPSLSEGLGTSVLDAMALEVPVVSSDAGGLPELVGGDAGIMVPAGDAEALARAVAQMLDDGELRGRSIAAGSRVVERFSAAAMAAGMRSVYDSVIATH